MGRRAYREGEGCCHSTRGGPAPPIHPRGLNTLAYAVQIHSNSKSFSPGCRADCCLDHDVGGDEQNALHAPRWTSGSARIESLRMRFSVGTGTILQAWGHTTDTRWRPESVEQLGTDWAQCEGRLALRTPVSRAEVVISIKPSVPCSRLDHARRSGL